MKVLIVAFFMIVCVVNSFALGLDGVVVDVVEDTGFIMDLFEVGVVTQDFIDRFPDSAKPNLGDDILMFRITGWTGSIIPSFIPPTSVSASYRSYEIRQEVVIPKGRSTQRIKIYDRLGCYPSFRMSAEGGSEKFSFKQEGAEIVITRKPRGPVRRTKDCQVYVQFVEMRETDDHFSFFFTVEWNANTLVISCSPPVGRTVLLGAQDVSITVRVPKDRERQAINIWSPEGAVCLLPTMEYSGPFTIRIEGSSIVIERSKSAPGNRLKSATTWGGAKGQ